MSQSDKIEIYRWLDGEVAGDLPSRIGSGRSLAIRREIQHEWKGYVDRGSRLKPLKSSQRERLYSIIFANIA